MTVVLILANAMVYLGLDLSALTPPSITLPRYRLRSLSPMLIVRQNAVVAVAQLTINESDEVGHSLRPWFYMEGFNAFEKKPFSFRSGGPGLSRRIVFSVLTSAFLVG